MVAVIKMDLKKLTETVDKKVRNRFEVILQDDSNKRSKP